MRAILALFATLLLAAPLRAEMLPVSDWFALSEEAARNWIATELDDRRVRIQPVKAGHGPARSVLVLYPRQSSAYDTAMSRMLEYFRQRGDNIIFEAFNFKRRDHRGRAALALAEKSDSDLILAMGSDSVAWLHAHYRGGAIPVVSVCAKDPVELGQIAHYESGSQTNFAFTSLNMSVDVQLAYIRKLLPGLRTLAVLVDSDNQSAVQTQSRPLIAAAEREGLRAIEVAVRDPEQAGYELRELVPAALERMRETDPTLTHSALWITGSTSVFQEIAIINQAAGRLPVLSAVPDIVRPGKDSAVISIGVSFESNAYLAAVYAGHVLDGTARPGELPVGIVTPPDIAISFERARAIGLKIPFDFFERAGTVIDPEGRLVRQGGKRILPLQAAAR
ncbi:MAG: hypothetical protein KIT81_05450 [Alphaproteobacteria bacterium]|nr:hypothetical protein [Alphaproteobacteria bacterium]